MDSFHFDTNDLPLWGDVKLLHAFVATAQAGSISAAARGLGVAPSTVSKALRALEHACGHTLFWRTTRRLSLTAAGERLLPHGEQVLAQLVAARQALGDEAATLSGRLTVAAPAGLARYLLTGPLGPWLAAHPALRLQWRVGTRLVMPGEAGVDIALRVADSPSEDWVATALWQTRLVTVASPQYLAQHGEPATPAALAAHRCLVVCGGDGTPLPWRFDDRPWLPAAPALTADDESTVLAAAEAGLGIAQGLDYNLHAALAAGRLQVLLTAHRAAGPTVFALRPPGPGSGKVRAFLDVVRASAGGQGRGGA